jgi:CRP-like cAMP-binding protein
LKGSIVLHVDLNDPAIDSEHNKVVVHKDVCQGTNQRDHEAFNVPFNLIVEGSYFGDSDCLFQKRCIRESMAEAEKLSQLLIIKKQALEDLLGSFPDIKAQMRNIAKEKKKYYRRLILELLKKKQQAANHEDDLFMS